MSWAFQRGKDIDVMFAYNKDTLPYWELEEQYPNESGNFPSMLTWHDIKLRITDIIDNGFGDEEYALICTKSGSVIDTSYFDSAKEFNKATRPFTEKHFSFIIFRDYGGYEYFWFNGWDGFLKLQEYTNWFDMDLYDDLLDIEPYYG